MKITLTTTCNNCSTKISGVSTFDAQHGVEECGSCMGKPQVKKAVPTIGDVAELERLEHSHPRIVDTYMEQR